MHLTLSREIKKEIIIFSMVIFLVAVILFLLNFGQTEYRMVKVKYTSDQFQMAVDRTAKELNWCIYQNNEKFFRARRRFDILAIGWGEIITIIKCENCLYINCFAILGEPSWGRRGKNIKAFLKNLFDVVETEIV